jgi:hypothetical protein
VRVTWLARATLILQYDCFVLLIRIRWTIISRNAMMLSPNATGEAPVFSSLGQCAGAGVPEACGS